MENTQSKVIKPLNLSIENITWITQKAAEMTQTTASYMSASRLVDEIITKARKSEEAKVKKAVK